MKKNELKISASGDRGIVMLRSFDFRRDLIFDALTKPDWIRQWLLGPPGWTMPTCNVDLRIGGPYRYVWQNSEGKKMAVGGNFRTIDRPETLVHTEKFDEAWYPGEAVITTNLTEKDGVTTLSAIILYESTEARDTVLKSDMESGVAASYDRLEQLLDRKDSRHLSASAAL